MTGPAGLFGPDLRMLGDPGGFLSGTPVLLERTCPPPLGRGACVHRQEGSGKRGRDDDELMTHTHTHTLSWSRPVPCVKLWVSCASASRKHEYEVFLRPSSYKNHGMT